MAYLHFRKLYKSLVPVTNEAFLALETVPDQNEVFVQIKNLTKTEYRKACQNQLYWAWISDCSKTDNNEFAGNSIDEWHYQFKKDYLVRIYERDDKGYAIMMESLRDIYRSGMKSEVEVMRRHIIKETSTSKATVKQFCEYLNEIEKFCHNKGILLRTDSDDYKITFGIKLERI